MENEDGSPRVHSPMVIAFGGFYGKETEELMEAKLDAAAWLTEVVQSAFLDALALVSGDFSIGTMTVVVKPYRPLSQEEAILALEAREFGLEVEQEIFIKMPQRGPSMAAQLKGKWAGDAAPMHKGSEERERFVQLLASLMMQKKEEATTATATPGRYKLDIQKGTIEEMPREES